MIEQLLIAIFLLLLATSLATLLTAVRIRKLHSFFESVVADIESAFDEEEEGVIELDEPAAETWTETMNRLSKQEESGFEGIDQADEMEELVRQAQRAELAMRNLERKENVCCGMKGVALDDSSCNRCGHIPAIVLSYVPGSGTVCLKMLKQYSMDMAFLGFRSVNSTPKPLSDVWATLDFTCMAFVSEGNFMTR